MGKLLLIKGFLWIRYSVFDNPNLNSSDIMVYAALMRYMNNETKSCFPSIPLLAEKARLSKDTVIERLKVLEEQGLIVVSRELGKVNNYLLLEPNQSEIPMGSSRNKGEAPVGIKEANNTNLNNTNKTIVATESQQRIIEHLNERLGKKPPKGFKVTNQRCLKDLNARLREYSEADVIAVIDLKADEWLDTPMRKYVRPITLFNVNKFESYVNEIDIEGSENVGRLKELE